VVPGQNDRRHTQPPERRNDHRKVAGLRRSMIEKITRDKDKIHGEPICFIDDPIDGFQPLSPCLIGATPRR
jgi:hypothetical protein